MTDPVLPFMSERSDDNVLRVIEVFVEHPPKDPRWKKLLAELIVEAERRGITGHEPADPKPPKYTQEIRVKFEDDIYHQIVGMAVEDERTPASLVRKWSTEAVARRLAHAVQALRRRPPDQRETP